MTFPAFGPGWGGMSYVVPPTGADDTGNIQAALTSWGTANLAAGSTYRISATIVIPGGAELNGHGATITPLPGIAGPMFSLQGQQARIRNVQAYGGSTTKSANPAADVIVPAAGALRWLVENVYVLYCNGYAVNPAPATGPMHGTIKTLIGTNCSGGIKIAGGSSTNGQVNILDIDLQSCDTNPALWLSSITDIEVAACNLSVTGAAAVPTVQIDGPSQTILMSGMDCGVTGTPTAGIGVLHVLDNAGSPSEVDITSGTFQQGGLGVVLDGGCARMRFRGIMAKRNQGDGWQVNGTGTAILIDSCAGNTNNQAAGTAYDINVTSTAHVGIFAFAYCSSTVTNSLIVPATNHVTNANSTSPGGPAVSGTPSGW